MDRYLVQAETLTLIEKDFNGEAYVENVVGEVERFENNLIVIFPPGMPDDWTLRKSFSEVYGDGESAQKANAAAWLNSVYLINACYLTHYIYNGNYDLGRNVAYLRMLAVREGLVVPEQDPRPYHCKYGYTSIINNEIVNQLVYRRPNNTNGNYLTELFAAVNPGFDADGEPNDRTEEQAQLVARYTLDVRQATYLRTGFTDIVCLVAYFFRVRGHHYQEDFRDKMLEIWKATVNSEERSDVGIAWNFVARDALKCIFPIVLDNFWENAVKNSRCSGNLQKRFDSAAAGTAAIAAISRGAVDLLATFPKIKHHVEESLIELDRLTAILNAPGNRWAGSINRKFYAAPAITIDEGKLGPLASGILAALSSFAAKHPLITSPALLRISRNSPISGAVLAKVLTKYSESDLAVAHYAGTD